MLYSIFGNAIQHAIQHRKMLYNIQNRSGAIFDSSGFLVVLGL
jgi:hypothetical protein